MKLLALDGNSIANRAYYGIKLLTTKDGHYTNAIFGFMNILLHLLEQVQPDEVAVSFDVHAPTFRHKMYDGYKAGRHPMPNELREQMPIIRQLLEQLGFRVISAEGWEADDLLGTLAHACAARGDHCYISTGDRDSLQLVSDSTTVLLSVAAQGKSQTVAMDPAAIREKYGVEPLQLIEVKGLMGDHSDNLPGIPGIGEKTALALIKRYGTLAGVYEHLDDVTIKPKQRENLVKYKASAEMSLQLGTIRTDAPIDTAPGAYARAAGDPQAAAATLRRLEIFTLIPRFGLEQAAQAAAEQAADLPLVQPTPLPQGLSGTLYLAQRPAKIEKQGNKHVETAPAVWYAVQGQAVYTIADEAQLAALLENPALELQAFDTAPLYALAYRTGGEGRRLVYDGKLAAYLLDAGAARYVIAELIAGYHVAHAFSCPEYPDAGALEALFAHMKQAITDRQEDELYNTIEFPLARVLAEMTHLGMLVNRQGIEEFGVMVKQSMEEALARIYLEAGREFNPNSPQQLGKILFDELKLPHGKKNQRGWSTDAATLENLRHYPIVEDILEYRTYAKLYSTYVVGLLGQIGPDGRIHSTFNQTEARTGRLSSDNPNLQNIPIRTELGSKLREYFIAKPGCVLLDADYSQIELRILAHVSGDENMQEAFRSGGDIHRSTAARIYGLPPEQVTNRLRSGAKAINFGIMYGKGAYSLSKDLGVSVKEANAFLQSYLNAFPKISEYMDATITNAKRDGYVSTLFGRRRALPELNSSNFQVRSSGERMARNTPIQGTAADVIKLAMVRVWQRLRSEGLESKLILTVHDELIVEAPEAEAERAAAILGEEMMNCVHYAVPLTAEVQQGANWLAAHH